MMIIAHARWHPFEDSYSSASDPHAYKLIFQAAFLSTRSRAVIYSSVMHVGI